MNFPMTGQAKCDFLIQVNIWAVLTVLSMPLLSKNVHC